MNNTDKIIIADVEWHIDEILREPTEEDRKERTERAKKEIKQLLESQRKELEEEKEEMKLKLL
jgi:hypothetical protein